ncbi:MAG: hypothetical protein M1831_005285 [Alyxoria varia]|nr:MAG: hypothetical protein M1831_005285 [Alyxoria varia]
MVSFCTYCGHKFTRDEHLERHILTHTNVKPFSDLLNRHYTVHGRGGDQESSTTQGGFAPRSAGRTPIACTNCAKTKTKCDKKTPCSRCAARNLDCQSRPTRRTTKNNPPPIDNAAEGQTQSANKPTPSGIQSPDDETAPGSPEDDDALNSPPIPGAIDIDPTATHMLEGYPFQAQSGPPQSLDPLLANTYSTGSILSPALTPGANPMSGIKMHGMDGTVFTDPRQGFTTSLQQHIGPFSSEWEQAEFDETNMDHTQLQGIQPATSMSFPMDDSFGSVAMADCSPLNINPYMNGHDWVHSPVSPDQSRFPSGNQFLSSPPPSANSNSPPALGQRTDDAEEVIKGRDVTASKFVTALQDTLKDPQTWTKALQLQGMNIYDDASNCHFIIKDFRPEHRDKLSAVAQAFLQKAIKTHASSTRHSNNISRTLMLPSVPDLNYLLKCYGNVTERYYPLTSGVILDPNALMSQEDDKPSSLLLLLMISQGALLSNVIDGRWLAGGLVELCRLSLFDVIEKRIHMAGDVTCLHAAMLCIMQAAWSGDKWHMDIAMGQRNLYLSMLQHHGFPHDNSQQQGSPQSESHRVAKLSVDEHWTEWRSREQRSRIFYCWLLLEQELCLFHDRQMVVRGEECMAPLPDSEYLWRAQTAEQWHDEFESIHTFSDGRPALGRAFTPSLRQLFCLFYVNKTPNLTPFQLRLLLCHLQDYIFRAKSLDKFESSTPGASNWSDGDEMLGASRVMFERVRLLLNRWQDLCDRYLEREEMCSMLHSSLVMFHLVSLLSITDIPEIEDFARSGRAKLWTNNHLETVIVDVEAAVHHCGKALGLLKRMNRDVRPPWWAGAVYRVALILWFISITNFGTCLLNLSSRSGLAGPGENEKLDFIDQMADDQPHWTFSQGVPTLTPLCNGSPPLRLPDQTGILEHAVEVIRQGLSSRFGDGVCDKLSRLAKDFRVGPNDVVNGFGAGEVISRAS